MHKSTCVCNVKVKYIRPQYQNLKEWCDDPQNVYIGRKGIVFINAERYPKVDSIWANPFKVGDTSRENINKDAENGSRARVVDKYKNYIIKKINDDPDTYNLDTLKGKNLGCWCKPESCHGDVLLDLIG